MKFTKSLLALPILAGALLFTGCEGVAVVEHRDYDRGHHYGSTRRSYDDGYYRDSRPSYRSGYSSRSRADVDYTQNNVVVQRTNVNRTNIVRNTSNTTVVNRNRAKAPAQVQASNRRGQTAVVQVKGKNRGKNQRDDDQRR